MSPARLALVALLAAGTIGSSGVRRDLDVALPPGSPLDWAGAFGSYAPPRPFTPSEPLPDRPGETRAPPVGPAETDARFGSSFGMVRILTWDLTAHLTWIVQPVSPPTHGPDPRAPAPRYGEPLYWLTLAPLLRLLLHPNAVSSAETVAHLVELGEPVLPVLRSADSERSLGPVCAELRRLIRPDKDDPPTPPSGANPREAMLARFTLEECLRAHPHDPSGTFGQRLFLFSEEVEPWLVRYAHHPSLTLQRNAVAALARYPTRPAALALLEIAAHAEDPVSTVRALAALGRYQGGLDPAPLLERLEKTREPALRVALIGALGRMGAKSSIAPLLALGERALDDRDREILNAVLAALARLPTAEHAEEVRALCQRTTRAARIFSNREPHSESEQADQPDAGGLRATIVADLALLARFHADPGDEELAQEVLALAVPVTADARLSLVGAGGIDPLGNVPAALRFLYLEALVDTGARGNELLEDMARGGASDAGLRGRALALLPRSTRALIAPERAESVSEEAELRVQALEVMLFDGHPRDVQVCKGLLARAARQAPGSLDPGERYLCARALQHLGDKGALQARELLPFYSHLRASPQNRRALRAELRAQLEAYLDAAERRAPEQELDRRAEAILVLAFDLRVNAGLLDQERPALLASLRSAAEQQRGQRERDRERAQHVAVLDALYRQLSGEAPSAEDPNRAEFAPSVPFEEELLLALGRARQPAAAELLLQLLRDEHSDLRGWACRALARCEMRSTAGALLPFLVDPDPFVRLCAYESLRTLTGKDVELDWMSAPPAERQAGAEAYRAWLAEQR